MSRIFGDMDVETFLSGYWQKKPLLVRGALADYTAPLDEHDLAGLACEELAESRLVQGSYEGNDWRLDHGPFSDDRFSGLAETNWTLLVQDVEKHYPPLQSLMERFQFIPSWRLDDLMVSFAAPGGSVGPHVDQYDVFLLQVTGRKRWQVATEFKPERLEDCPLDMLNEFDPQQEWLLEAGDMLYLPPNVAHHGVAVDAGMTWSVGLRAPSAADIFADLSEQLSELPGGGPRYRDPPLGAASRPGEVQPNDLQQAARMLRAIIDDPFIFNQYFASFMSRFRLAQDPVNPGPEVNWQQVQQRLAQGDQLARNPWTRLTWIESPGGAKLFAAGLPVDCSVELAENLCRSATPAMDSIRIDDRDQDALCLLVNAGHLVFFRD